MTWRLDVLPSAQRAFWDGEAERVPAHYVLYGGTAVALRHGHRQSVDFDFFTEAALDEPALRAALPLLAGAIVLHRAPGTLTVSVALAGEPVKLSFFAGITFGRVGVPERHGPQPPLASPLDLLATKLKALLERIEPKDYLDVEVLLRSGLSLEAGTAALHALFGTAVNPLDVAKAVAWFREGGLEARLPEGTRRYLTERAAAFQPPAAALPILSHRLT